jgi:hypothetical protein
MLSSRGITIRCDLRSDDFHTTARSALCCAWGGDNAAADVAVVNDKVKFTNMRLTTMEIVPSIEFQRALLDLQMAKGYFAFPTYSV